jgi:hypothetical protein
VVTERPSKQARFGEWINARANRRDPARAFRAHLQPGRDRLRQLAFAQAHAARDHDGVERGCRPKSVMRFEGDAGARFESLSTDTDRDRLVAALPALRLVAEAGCRKGFERSREVDSGHSVEPEKADQFRGGVGDCDL